jgi:hypothetical protein
MPSRRPSSLLVSALSLVLALCAGGAARGADMVIADFEGDLDGFTGAIRLDAAADVKIGKGAAFMENTKADGWVEAARDFPDLCYDFTAVSFFARSTTAHAIGVRLTDASGQNFLRRVALDGSGRWEQLGFATTDAVTQSWGGAADKTWHPPARSITFVLEGGSNAIELDGISATLAPRPVPELAALARKQARARTVTLADFEKGVDGFDGNVVRDTTTAKVGKDCARLDDVTEKWIATGKDLDVSGEILALDLWVGSPNADHVALRVTDSGGQCFQHRYPLNPGVKWQRIHLPASAFADGESWGGAADKTFHGPARRLDILLEKPGCSVFFDAVSALVAPP